MDRLHMPTHISCLIEVTPTKQGSVVLPLGMHRLRDYAKRTVHQRRSSVPTLTTKHACQEVCKSRLLFITISQNLLV
jgi:hypothetical protein